MTYFLSAKTWVAEAVGLIPTDIRAEKLTNDVRQLLYSMYNDLQIACDFKYSTPVECFCRESGHCAESFKGIRLPADLQAVETIRTGEHGKDIPHYSQFRTPWDGITAGRDPIEYYDRGSAAPTERDLSPCGTASKLSWTSDARDKDTIITITGIDHNGEPFAVEDVTGTGRKKSETLVRWIDAPGGVKFSKPLEGTVFLSQEGGRILSVYGPGTMIPQFRTYQLEGCSSSCSVFVQGPRRFKPLSCDTDLVEIDNNLVWTYLAKHLNLMSKTDKDGQDHGNAASFLAQARELIIGDQTRDTSISRQQVFRRAPQNSLQGVGSQRRGYRHRYPKSGGGWS